MLCDDTLLHERVGISGDKFARVIKKICNHTDERSNRWFFLEAFEEMDL